MTRKYITAIKSAELCKRAKTKAAWVPCLRAIGENSVEMSKQKKQDPRLLSGGGQNALLGFTETP